MKRIKKALVLFFLFSSAQASAFDQANKLDLAKGLIESYDCPEAIRVLSDLVVDTEVNNEAVTLILSCHFKMKKFETVIALGREFLLANPLHFESRMGITKSFISLNQKDNALEESATLFKIHNQNEEAVVLYARLLADRDRTQAINVLTEYHSKNKDTGATRLLLAELYIKERQYPAALDELKRVLSIGPITEEVYISLSKAYLGISKFDKAIDSIKFAAKFAPDSPEPFIELSKIHLAMGQMENSKNVLATALGKVSVSARGKILIQLARLQLQQGLHQLARETLSSAEQISPQRNTIQYLIIKSYLAENDLSTASMKLGLFIREHPSNNWAILAQARILKMTASDDVVTAWVSEFFKTSENPNELKDFLAKNQKGTAARLPASSPNFERVKVGDTLYGISKRIFGRSSLWKSIYEWNRNILNDPNFLREGMWLKICRGKICLN